MLALVLLLPFPALDPGVNARLAHAPPAIGRFLERRAECEHWAGEEPYDKARAAEITRAETRLDCGDRLDADEAALRRRFARKPAMLRLLDLKPAD